MRQENRLPQKVPADFHHRAGKRRRYDHRLVDLPASAVHLFIPAQVQTFVQCRAGLFPAPPLLPGPKEHARMEQPLPEAVQAGPVNGQQQLKEPAGNRHTDRFSGFMGNAPQNANPGKYTVFQK